MRCHFGSLTTLCDRMFRLALGILPSSRELPIWDLVLFDWCRYHVPRAWLQATGNLLVLFEEIGGDVTSISVVTRSASAVCAHIEDSQPPPVESWNDRSQEGSAQAVLECADGQHISHIKFASFGNPRGSCGHFHHGKCHAKESLQVVQKVNNPTPKSILCLFATFIQIWTHSKNWHHVTINNHITISHFESIA